MKLGVCDIFLVKTSASEVKHQPNPNIVKHTIVGAPKPRNTD